MRDLAGRFVGFLGANRLRLLTIVFLLIAVVLIVLQFQTNSILARTVGKLAAGNELLGQEMSAQNVVIGQLNQEKEALEDTVAQATQLLQQSVSTDQVFWCTDGLIPAEVLSEEVDLALRYVDSLPTEVQPLRLCVDLWSIFGSPQTGEIYISISREFQGGAGERFIVYLEPVPEQPDFVWISGHYNLITHEFVPLVREEVPEVPVDEPQVVEEPVKLGE